MDEADIGEGRYYPVIVAAGTEVRSASRALTSSADCALACTSALYPIETRPISR